jgi:uncharacterized Fe-S cluster-containing radical SAM superfamily protein
MYLTHVDPIKVETHLCDSGKRRKHDRCRWQRRVPLMTREHLLMLLSVLTHLALEEALDP